MDKKPRTPKELIKSLPLGSLVYKQPQDGTTIEIVLNNFFTTPETFLLLSDDYQDAWRGVGAALIEARREGHGDDSMEHPSELIGWVRRWLRENYHVYELINKGKHEVRLVIRDGEEKLLRKIQREDGSFYFTPVCRWKIEVIPSDLISRAPYIDW